MHNITTPKGSLNMKTQEAIESKFIKALKKNNYKEAEKIYNKIEDPYMQYTETSIIKMIFDNYIKTKNIECVELAKSIINSHKGFVIVNEDFFNIEDVFEDFQFVIEAIGYDQSFYKDEHCKLTESFNISDIDNSSTTLPELMILRGYSECVLSLIKAGNTQIINGITRETILKLLSLFRPLTEGEVNAFIEITSLLFKNTSKLISSNEIIELNQYIYLLNDSFGCLCENKAKLLNYFE